MMGQGCCSLRLSLAEVAAAPSAFGAPYAVPSAYGAPYAATAGFGPPLFSDAPMRISYDLAAGDEALYSAGGASSRPSMGQRGPSRRRRHTTMVTRGEFREVVASRNEGRPVDPVLLANAPSESHATPWAAEGRDRRTVSVLLTDEELERLQQGRL